jgi:hypothetical protein
METKPPVRTLQWAEGAANCYYIQFKSWYYQVRWSIHLRYLWPLRKHIRAGAIFEKNGHTREYPELYSRIDRIKDGTKLIFMNMDCDEFGSPFAVFNIWGTTEELDLDRFEEALWDGVLRRIDVDEE